MADNIRRVDYCYAQVPDRPGEVARVLASLREAGASFMSVLAFPRGQGTVQLDLVAGQGELDKAAAKAGVRLGPKKQAFFITGADRPGAAAELLGMLAEAHVNVTAASANCGPGGFGMMVWVKPAEVEAAARAFGLRPA